MKKRSQQSKEKKTALLTFFYKKNKLKLYKKRQLCGEKISQ